MCLFMWGYPKMDGLKGKIPFKWMIQGYPHLWKPPCTSAIQTLILFESVMTKGLHLQPAGHVVFLQCGRLSGLVAGAGLCIPHNVVTNCLTLENVTTSDWEFTTNKTTKHAKQTAFLNCPCTFLEFLALMESVIKHQVPKMGGCVAKLTCILCKP